MGFLTCHSSILVRLSENRCSCVIKWQVTSVHNARNTTSEIIFVIQPGRWADESHTRTDVKVQPGKKSILWSHFSGGGSRAKRCAFISFCHLHFCEFFFRFECRLRRCCRREMMRFISISVLALDFFCCIFILVFKLYFYDNDGEFRTKHGGVCVRARVDLLENNFLRLTTIKSLASTATAIATNDFDNTIQVDANRHRELKCARETDAEDDRQHRDSTDFVDVLGTHTHTPIYLMTCIFISHFFNCSVFIPIFALDFYFCLVRSLFLLTSPVPHSTAINASTATVRVIHTNTHIQARSRTKNQEKKKKAKKEKKRIKFMNERNYMKLFRKLFDNETRAHTYEITRWQRTSVAAGWQTERWAR